MSDEAAAVDPSKSGRKSDGTFAPGNKGNPKGRPQGSRNQVTLALEQMMADDGAAVVQAVLDAAKAGDMTAARIIVDRLAPARKDRPVTMDLPKIASAADIPAATQAILEATAAGELTPSEGAALVNIAENHRKAVELAEIDARLARIEAQLGSVR
jgi:hypothetical protein